MGKIIEIGGVDIDQLLPEDNGYSTFFAWDGKTDAKAKALWTTILETARTKGSAFVYLTYSSSWGYFIIGSSSIPYSSGNMSIIGYGGYWLNEKNIQWNEKNPMVKLNVTINDDNSVTVNTVNSPTWSTQLNNLIYKMDTIGVQTTLNSTALLYNGNYARRINSSTVGTPITFTEETAVHIETRCTYTEPNATYSPYIRQDLYAPSLDRHWYRIVNYAASNNITYGEWKEIDLAFEIVE